MGNSRLENQQFIEENRQTLYRRLREIRASIGSQKDVAKLFNQVQGSVSRYEKGNRTPPLSYIRELSRHAGLAFTEEQYLLGLAGVAIPTRMPSAEQIIKGMEAYCNDIQSDWYPCMIVDHNFGIWVVNKAAADILGEGKTEALISQYVTNLEIVFSPEIEYEAASPVYDIITKQLNRTRQQQIALFKLFNLQRRHEAFYKHYPRHLGYFGKDKPRIRAEQFVGMWNQVDIVGERGELQFKEGSVEITGVLQTEAMVDVRYRQRMEPIPHLPMFGVIRYEPFYEFHPLFEGYKQSTKRIVKLWEIAEIEAIIEGIDGLNLLEPINGFLA